MTPKQIEALKTFSFGTACATPKNRHHFYKLRNAGYIEKLVISGRERTGWRLTTLGWAEVAKIKTDVRGTIDDYL